MKELKELNGNYTSSIFYEIELTAKYCKMLGSQVFEKFNTGIQVDEFAILDTLMCNPTLCQRDLAKIILKDRANTGKILDSLEKKEWIKRELTIKNNRPVKIINLTLKGEEKIQEVMRLIEPHMNEVKAKIQDNDLDKIRDMLKNLRKVLNSTIELNI